MNHITSSKTTIINIFGGPGAGKSTAATYIFSHLRMKGVSCEYVPEFAKELSRAGDMEAIENQFYISAVQYQRQCRLLGKVDYIVTDSPVLSGLVYDMQKLKGFNDVLTDIQSKSKSINIFLRRDLSREYETEGRHHCEDDARLFDEMIEQLLIDQGVHYVALGAFGMDDLLEYIMDVLGVK